MGLVEQHKQLSGGERAFRELADIPYGGISAGYAISGKVNFLKFFEAGASIDLGTGTSGWGNTGWSETFSAAPLAVNVSAGIPGCSICTVGVEGTLGGPSLDYIPLDPHYLSNEGLDLLVQEGTWSSPDIGGQFLKYGSISASDTDIKFGGSAQAFFGIAGGINVSEAIDAGVQAYDYVVNTASGWFGDSGGASGGFLLYPSKPNLNQVRAYRK